MGFTDEELATLIADQVAGLGKWVGMACDAGLRVDVVVDELRQIGRYEALPIIRVRVYRPL